jgi:DNA-binding transcriptional ArsR family regulator
MALSIKHKFPADELLNSKIAETLSHPIRVRILFQLWMNGPTFFQVLHKMTIGTEGNCSHHLSDLYKLGLIDRYDEDGFVKYKFQNIYLDQVLPYFGKLIDKYKENPEESCFSFSENDLLKFQEYYQIIKSNRAKILNKKLKILNKRRSLQRRIT